MWDPIFGTVPSFKRLGHQTAACPCLGDVVELLLLLDVCEAQALRPERLVVHAKPQDAYVVDTLGLKVSKGLLEKVKDYTLYGSMDRTGKRRV